MGLAEKIKEYDARKDVHYFVYFSSNTYKWEVDVMTFKKKSDLADSYYRNMRYYNTYATAKAVADKKNAADTDIGHLIGRASAKYVDELRAIEAQAKNSDAPFKMLSVIDLLERTAGVVSSMVNDLNKGDK